MISQRDKIACENRCNPVSTEIRVITFTTSAMRNPVLIRGFVLLVAFGLHREKNEKKNKKEMRDDRAIDLKFYLNITKKKF